MKNLVGINEWKNSTQLDEGNVNELQDIFLPIIDLGCLKFEIIIDEFVEESYNIKWVYNINLNIGSYPNIVTSESIRKHKESLIKFNNLQEETHDILERLLDIGYSIAYYSVDSGVDSVANPIFRFEIRLSKKNLTK